MDERVDDKSCYWPKKGNPGGYPLLHKLYFDHDIIFCF